MHRYPNLTICLISKTMHTTHSEATVYVDDETATEGFQRCTSRAYSNPVAMQVRP